MTKKLFTIVSVLVVAAFVLVCTQPTVLQPKDLPAQKPNALVRISHRSHDRHTPRCRTVNSRRSSARSIQTPLTMLMSLSMTQISLLTTDRVGGIIFNAIEGETVAYNGTDYLYKGPADTKVVYDAATDTTKYTATLKEGLKFSDGKPVTADDIIFTYYTYLDPSYVGSTTLSSYDIVGLKDYQTQTTSDVYDKYAAMADAIFAAGLDHVWAATDTWTKEQQDDFWARIDEGVKAEVQKIVDYVIADYLDYGPDYFGMTGDEISANEGIKVAFGMTMWGYGGSECQDEVAEGADPVKLADCKGQILFKTGYTDKSFDLVTSFPTLQTTRKISSLTTEMFKQPSRMNPLMVQMFWLMLKPVSSDSGAHKTRAWVQKVFLTSRVSLKLTITPWKLP